MTTKPLWAKAGIELDEEIIRYCAGNDWQLDHELLAFDLLGSIAHVKGLMSIEALTESEGEALLSGLHLLLEEHRAGQFSTTPDDEDGHSAIERALTERLGEVGKRVHLGRSRNDQVLTATRLWLMARLREAAELCLRAAEVALDRAATTTDQFLPGYTHLQRAVPSSVGFWFAGHAESWLEDALALSQAATLLDASPLGTAAGYGVNLALDREGAQAELGFERMIINGLCAQNGRGRLEAHAISALLCAMGTVRRFSWDLSLFAMSELGFVRLPTSYTTGSSIMPNKRNPDVVEIMRAAFADVAGAHTAVLQVLSLPSGYQRDLQRTKAPVMTATKVALDTMRLLPALLRQIEFVESAAAAALDTGMLATDRAVDLAVSGVPFRDAYRQVAQELQEDADASEAAALLPKARQSLAARTSLGGPGNLMLDRLRERLARIQVLCEAPGA